MRHSIYATKGRLCPSLANLVLAIVAVVSSTACHAFITDMGNPDTRGMWYGTSNYSAVPPVADLGTKPLCEPRSNSNDVDESDRTFENELISTHLAVLKSSNPVQKPRDGHRASAADAYDIEYNKGNDNDSTATAD
ncbi:hypothetical protein D3C84_896020 [compost metagenome]